MKGPMPTFSTVTTSALPAPVGTPTVTATGTVSYPPTTVGTLSDTPGVPSLTSVVPYGNDNTGKFGKSV